MTWQDKQAAQPDPIAAALAAWHLLPSDPQRTRMSDAIQAYEDALVLCRQCDEPGCEREASCGWPVPDGYRRTCGEHMQRITA